MVSTVKAIVGLPHITRMLRHEKRRRTNAASSAVPGAEGRTGADGDSLDTSTGLPSDGAHGPAAAQR